MAWARAVEMWGRMRIFYIQQSIITFEQEASSHSPCDPNAHHKGVRETVTEVHSKFWVIGGFEILSYQSSTAELSADDLKRTYLRSSATPSTRISSEGNSTIDVHDLCIFMAKICISLFTCCASRAIHLELALDMSTATFIRRGLLLDLEASFKSAAVIRTVCDHPDVRSYLGIDCNFSLEKAASWGGLFKKDDQVHKALTILYSSVPVLCI